MSVKHYAELAAAGKAARRKDLRGCKDCKDKMLDRMGAVSEAKGLNVIPVIPCHNESDRLEDTLRHLMCGNVLGHIVVVDDMSTDKCTRRCMRDWEWSRLERKGRITIKRGTKIHFIRNGRRGVGGSRQVGGDLAFKLGATTAFFLDGHVAVDSHDVIDCGRIAEERMAIVQPTCLGWQVAKTSRRYGGNLGWHERRILGVGYVKRRPPPEDPRWINKDLLQVKGLIGANGYAVPKTVWDRIDGWSTECGLWGFNEQLITTKAFFANVPLICDARKSSRHYFKSARKEGLEISQTAYWYSRWAVLRYLFSDRTFIQVWLPLLRARRCNTTLWDAMHAPKLLAARDRYLPLRERPEVEWFEEFLPGHQNLWEGKV